ncbi:dephospho-CoA kinase [Longilinea arvoryzae]|uniref:Dephospho-CoA kinase n=1 Tax=Longilinea arvoryzae TaxID=360412 RepID=A0A0S7BK98_9CHLR|nr:dephospho-CoA kinase [Longilinea arvoryzae]GAP15588.1 dephospho-CoA kinase [Longilinea arvoryzae]
MTKWAGKYVIGLTGNIGTGKSVVRRMLEHLGAYGIDADALSHRAIAKGAPGYQPILSAFGSWILMPDGEIDRVKLGRLVFNDPDALVTLERIIHPLVNQAVGFLAKRASQKVIVIEAIKLLESALVANCDSVWVTYASPQIQIARLVQKRHMTDADARQRIAAQPPQEEKIAAATVVIRNELDFEDTWRQVSNAWQKFIPEDLQAAPAPAQEARPAARLQGQISVRRGRPRDSEEIAAIFNRLSKNGTQLTRDDIMAAFGEKAFLVLQTGNQTAGVMGWQVENLVARATDIYIDPAVPAEQAISAFIKEMERSSRDLQCEASLVFVPKELATLDSVWQSLGYEPREASSLGVQAWQEAAEETKVANTVLFFKQLRQDRVLRPI